MNVVSKLLCRTFQIVFRAALPILPYREPKIVPSCDALGEVFSEKKTSSVLIVTDAGIVKNGLVAPVEDVLKKNMSNMRYTIKHIQPPLSRV